MGAVGTAIIYGIIGVVIATAIALGKRERSAWWLIASAVFWPIFAPFVLAATVERRDDAEEPVEASTFGELRIRATEAQLVAALSKLEGIAEEILQPEIERIRRLAIALRGMAVRVTEMEALLETPEFSIERARAALADVEARSGKKEDPRRASVESRIRNIERLGAMRARTAEALERALLEMEEMSAQMMVLKFAGRPDAEVVHMIKEIAASIEAVAEGLLEAA